MVGVNNTPPHTHIPNHNKDGLDRLKLLLNEMLKLLPVSITLANAANTPYRVCKTNC